MPDDDGGRDRPDRPADGGFFVVLPVSGRGPDEGRDPEPAARRATVGAVAGLVALGVLVAASLVTWLVGRPPSQVQAALAPASAEGYVVWAANRDGTPVRWNACEPIRWVLNGEGAPADARQQVQAAMDVMGDASGIRFAFEGLTDERPSSNRPPYQPDRYDDRWAPVLVAWATPGGRGQPSSSGDTSRRAAVPLDDQDRAIAIPVAVERGGISTFISAQVVLNADVRTGLRDPRASWGSTLLHELGHVVGLDHVDDPAQVMYPYPGNGRGRLGDGDRAGLAVLGLDAGCLPVPSPAPVDVTYVDDFGH